MAQGASSYATRHTQRRLAPLPDGWLTIHGRDQLVRLTETGEPEVLVEFEPWLGDREPEDSFLGRQQGLGLHTSADGRFAAVVTDYGHFGTVVDLHEQREVLELHRESGWDVDTVPFGIAFLPDGTLIAQTDWNRVDAFALPGGGLLTEREVLSNWPVGEPCPENGIDYFHGALHASPSGRWLLADGWFWHPAPAPSLIDVAAWLGGDTHVPERMPWLDTEDYLWDIPVAWLDDNTVALQRIHHEGDRAVVTDLYDAPSRERVGQLRGLDGPMWAHQGRLYVSSLAGLETWDPGSGRRIGLVEGIRPTAHNPATGGFAELVDGTLRTFHPASGVVSTAIAHYGA